MPGNNGFEATIRTAIVDAIKNSGIDNINPDHVYRSDRSNFEGYPAIIVTPTDQDSDYNDTSSKGLNYTFIVRVHQTIPDVGQDEAEQIVEQIYDDLTLLFSNSSALPRNAAEWVSPVIGAWAYQTRETGQVRTAELKLKVRKYTS